MLWWEMGLCLLLSVLIGCVPEAVKHLFETGYQY